MGKKSIWSGLAVLILSLPRISAGQDARFCLKGERLKPLLKEELKPGDETFPSPLPLEPWGKSPEDTIAYDGPNFTSFGRSGGGSFYSAVRFTPTDSCTLNALIIYLAEQSWSCSLCIWDEGTPTNPGPRLDTWTDTSVADAWNRFDLPTPIWRDSAQEFWGGVWLTQAAGQYPVGCDSGPAVPQRSYVSTNGITWSELPSVGLDRNINDRAIVKYATTVHDVHPTFVSAPGTGAWKDTAYAVEATVANSGDWTESFDVECIIRDSGMSPVYGDTQGVANLDPGTQTPVPFSNWTPLLYDEVYTMSVVTLLGGDEHPENDTLFRTIQSYEEGEIAYDDFVAEAFYVVSVPNGASDAFAVRFTPYLPPSFYVTKWKIYVYDNTPLDNVRLCPDAGGAPDWDNPYQIFPGPGAILAPEWLSMGFDTLLTRMDTSGDLWLGAQFAPSDTGPGIGADSTPPLNGRSYWTDDLTAWNWLPAADFLMRIVHRPVGAIHDGEVVSIAAPPDTVFTGFIYRPIAVVANRGNLPESFEVTCTIDTYEDTVSVLALAPGSVLPCTFDLWTVPLADSTAYLMEARTWVPGDSNPSNDTLSKSIFAYNPHDVGVEQISSPPDTVYCDSTYGPVALVRNYGEAPETLEVVCAIDGYEDTVRVAGLGPGSELPCTFSVWTVPPPDSTSYVVTAFTLLAYDRESANDTLSKTIFAYRVGVEEGLVRPAIPAAFGLSESRPNPFAKTTAIPYAVASAVGGPETAVSLSIYNLAGQLVRTLVDRMEGPAYREAIWDGTDESGRPVTEGIYFVRLCATERSGPASNREPRQFRATRKLVVLR